MSANDNYLRSLILINKVIKSKQNKQRIDCISQDNNPYKSFSRYTPSSYQEWENEKRVRLKISLDKSRLRKNVQFEKMYNLFRAIHKSRWACKHASLNSLEQINHSKLPRLKKAVINCVVEGNTKTYSVPQKRVKNAGEATFVNLLLKERSPFKNKKSLLDSTENPYSGSFKNYTHTKKSLSLLKGEDNKWLLHNLLKKSKKEQNSQRLLHESNNQLNSYEFKVHVTLKNRKCNN